VAGAAVVKLILGALRLSGLTPALAGALAGILAVAVLWHWAAVRAAKRASYEAALADVRAANVKADGMATAGQVMVENCFDRGGEWNREAGKCAMP
jgi:hypothetical protein